jgi:hypothetical protein
MERTKLTVALVGCGKRKVITESGLPAKDLYKGSLYRLSMRYALEVAEDVHILSALHGLVSPYQLLTPYDKCITQMSATQQYEWGERVIRELDDAYPNQPLHIQFFAGMHYIRPIVKYLPERLGFWTWENPLIGKDLFRRLSWLKENLIAIQERQTEITNTEDTSIDGAAREVL